MCGVELVASLYRSKPPLYYTMFYSSCDTYHGVGNVFQLAGLLFKSIAIEISLVCSTNHLQSNEMDNTWSCNHVLGKQLYIANYVYRFIPLNLLKYA